MANNIVQLKDYNDNNIYPLAGGMTADSINTQMLKDGAVTTDKIPDDAITTDKIADASVTSDKIDWTTSTIQITVVGKSVNVQKVELGGGIVMISTHQLVTNVAFSANATNVKLAGLPAMSTPLFCNLEAMQIGQSSTYVSYPHFSTDCQSADCYVRNTTATTGTLEINFIVIGIPA